MDIRGCRDCPMLSGNECLHLDGPERVYPSTEEAPDFCPLRRGPVTVQLEEEMMHEEKMHASKRRQPEVIEQMESFMREVAVLMDRVEELDGRLLPVSRPRIDEKRVESPIAELGAPFAQALQGQIENLSVANCRLGDILARLEV